LQNKNTHPKPKQRKDTVSSQNTRNTPQKNLKTPAKHRKTPQNPFANKTDRIRLQTAPLPPPRLDRRCGGVWDEKLGAFT